jgi:DNA helicase IV
MDIFKSELEQSPRGVQNFTLSVTWRCPKSVVEQANRFFPDYSAREDAEDGLVESHVTLDPSAGDLVLCRVNAPLVSECFAMIAEGKAAYVLGRDIGYSLEVLIKKVTKDGEMPIEDFLATLDDYVNKRMQVLKRAEKENQIQSLQDKYDCIIALSGRTSTVAGLHDNIKEIFGEQGRNSGVVFSTVHKAKGLEAENVWIISPDKMPHPMAKTPSAREQEKNLCYVAVTRAMKTLRYVGGPVG